VTGSARSERYSRAYLIAASAGGFALLAYALHRAPAARLPSLLVVMVLAVFAEAVPVRLPGMKATVSVGSGVIVAAIMLFGSGWAGLVAALGTVRLVDLRGKIPVLWVLFNRAQLGASATLAGLAYEALRGSGGGVAELRSLGAIVVAGGLYFVFNAGFVSAFFSLRDGVAILPLWTKYMRWATPHNLALIPVGVLLALVYASVGWVGAVLFFVPLLVARYAMQRYTDLKEFHGSTVRALVRAVEAKDPYTRGHSDRVARYAVALGRQFRFSEDKLERLEYAAVLHDIGKIGIADSILLKPGRLEPGEYAVMKRHPALGADIVSEVRPLDQEVVDWIRYHHEWYDGNGYPTGRSGEEIPLGAQIIGVADALDAMTTVRPYKRALTLQGALEEMRRHSGRQFSPVVVDALIAAVKEGKLELAEPPIPIERQEEILAGSPPAGEPGEAEAAPEPDRARPAAALRPKLSKAGAPGAKGRTASRRARRVDAASSGND